MNIPSVIDVTIGLIIIYLFFSLLSSQIQELIAAILQWRSNALKQSIIILLGGSDRNSNLDENSSDPKNSNAFKARKIVELLYDNSLIKSINQSELKDKGRQRSNGPSYIPAETFATALIEILKLEFPSLSKQEAQFDDIVAEIDSSTFLPTSLKDNLVGLARRAQRKVTDKEKQLLQFQKEIEAWFNRSMDRAAGVYKRNAKGVTIILGIIISAIANVDTLNIINKLSKETALRSVIIQNASKIENCHKGNANELSCVDQQVSDELQSKTPLPLGWNQENRVKIFSLSFLEKIVGFILSALAISMGSPFWFDILNKVVNVRDTGSKPQSNNTNKGE